MTYRDNPAIGLIINKKFIGELLFEKNQQSNGECGVNGRFA